MSLKIVPHQKQLTQLLEALRLQMGRTQAQPGCLQCRLSQDTRNQNIVLYQEEWVSWQDLEHHIRSDRFLSILELMEHSNNEPELTFNDVSETRGMEYVRELRRTNGESFGGFTE